MQISTSGDFICVTMTSKEADVIAASIAIDIVNRPDGERDQLLTSFSLALHNLSYLINH